MRGKALILAEIEKIPNFTAPISNVTVALGREAILECGVDNLSAFKVAWLRVDTQTILTIHSHVITKNHRIAVTHTEHRNWYLHIRDVREADKGWYMCQINTDPMKSQVGYLNVVVPPDILDYPTSADMVVREGANVSLRCAATGSPEPSIMWRREGGESITLPNGHEVPSLEGPMLNITKASRLHMGPYLCIASNGVPPSVSKRIMLIVHFSPMIWIQNQLVGAMEGQQITLECHSEAYPKSINYWTKNDGHIISQGTKYEPVLVDNAYKVHMKLTIKAVNSSDYGSYKCIAKNSLGETDGTIKLYHIPTPSTPKPTTITTTRLPATTRKSSSKSKMKIHKDTPIDLTLNEIGTEEITKERDISLPSSQGNPRNIEKLENLGEVLSYAPTASGSSVVTIAVGLSLFTIMFVFV
ncbi:hypothetical protein GWI33_007850 [Rhynchophorus ferrugineus]|uniref:Ig-like domain-containing protein n=1 Tax=Rhynchophorus ferrugineus TaxID=354439 RepID=A0A834IJ97_RHYFE|nr:hypothetical protein GWI33_007850 [Rhynchophorus ferrugineus]